MWGGYLEMIIAPEMPNLQIINQNQEFHKLLTTFNKDCSKAYKFIAG